jgi:phosphoglycolate phosphatase
VTYRLVIFDFDGTLADSFPWFLSVVNRVAGEFGLSGVPPEEVDALRRLSARELVRRQNVPAWMIPQIALRLRELMTAELDRISPFPGVAELIDDLALAGVQTALVTSNSAVNARAILGPACAGRFDHFECGASIFGKPAKFRRVVRRAGVAAAETLCVGDELRDHEAARAARLDFGAVAWGYTAPEALQAVGPDHFFPTVEALARALLPARAA